MSWPEVPLRELIAHGDKVNYGVVQPGPEVVGGIPLIRVGDLASGMANLAELKRIGDGVEAKHKKSRLVGDEVLLACVGSIGTVALARPELKGANIARAVARIRCSEKLERTFLAHYLRTAGPQQYFVSETRTVAQPTLNIKQIEALSVPLPPLPEQKRIAAILDKADDIRRKRAEAIKLTEELLRSAFLEMFGDPVTNPKGWEVKKLGDERICKVQGGLQVTRKRELNPIEVPYLRVANVYRDRLNLDEIKMIRVTEGELDRIRLVPGDVLIVEGHGNPQEIGRSSVWDGSIEDCVHQNHLIRVRCVEGYLSPAYLSAFLNSDGGRRQLISFGKTTSGLNTISSGNVRAVSIPLPSAEVQEKFERFLQRLGRFDKSLAGFATAAVGMARGLTQQAFSGRL